MINIYVVYNDKLKEYSKLIPSPTHLDPKLSMALFVYRELVNNLKKHQKPQFSALKSSTTCEDIVIEDQVVFDDQIKFSKDKVRFRRYNIAFYNNNVALTGHAKRKRSLSISRSRAKLSSTILPSFSFLYLTSLLVKRSWVNNSQFIKIVNRFTLKLQLNTLFLL